jgi:hypothetical protein
MLCSCARKALNDWRLTVNGRLGWSDHLPGAQLLAKTKPETEADLGITLWWPFSRGTLKRTCQRVAGTAASSLLRACPEPLH